MTQTPSAAPAPTVTAAHRKERPTTAALTTALHDELAAMLADGEMNARKLGQIQQVAQIGAQLLVACKGPDAALNGLRRSVQYGIQSGPVMMPNPMYGGSYEGDDDGVQMPSPVGSSSAETFGTRMAGQFLTAITEMNKPKPEALTDLVNAVAAANREGLHDLAATIRQQIADRVGGSATAAPPAVTNGVDHDHTATAS